MCCSISPPSGSLSHSSFLKLTGWSLSLPTLQQGAHQINLSTFSCNGTFTLKTQFTCGGESPRAEERTGWDAKDFCTKNIHSLKRHTRWQQVRLDRKSDVRDRRKVSRNEPAPDETDLVLIVPKVIQETLEFYTKKKKKKVTNSYKIIFLLKFCFSWLCWCLQMLLLVSLLLLPAKALLLLGFSYCSAYFSLNPISAGNYISKVLYFIFMLSDWQAELQFELKK